VHEKCFKNLEKNIFRTLCTVIAQVLGMEAKFNCLIWITQTSLQGFPPIATHHNCHATKLGGMACYIAPKQFGGGNMWPYCNTFLCVAISISLIAIKRCYSNHFLVLCCKWLWVLPRRIAVALVLFLLQ